MIDVRKVEVQSIEELILALHPIHASVIDLDHTEAALSELRNIKNNVSAVLSFTSYSLNGDMANDPEFRHVIDEVRRECLLINGIISRIMFRQRWLFSASKVEDACEVLAHYEDMASAACRMCLLFAPELGNNLLSAF
ncbi:MAG: hypothetical protein ABSD13_13175 [Candidatus Korobacteraceae bacterium]|jgi:hypothetical protein